jgi:pilus assembly protein Flp/PilA
MTKLVSATRKLERKLLEKFFAAKQFVAKKQEGASLVEYGLLVGLIAVICIAAVTILGQNISTLFSRIAGATTP